MYDNNKVIIAIVAAVIVVAAAIGGAFLLLNNNDSSDTKNSIVGCYFDYKVAGDFTEEKSNEEVYYPISGTYKMTVLSEDDTRYEVKSEYNIYYSTPEGSKITLINKVETEWIEKNSDSLSSNDTKVTIDTYWGQKECVKKVATKEGTKTTQYTDSKTNVLYEQVSEKDGMLGIFMLKDSDFITKSKTWSFHSFSLEGDISGNAVPRQANAQLSITGTVKYDYLDATGTCYQVKFYMSYTISGVKDPFVTSYTKWHIDDNNGTDYGTKSSTDRISTTWGSLETDVYIKTEKDGGETDTITTYLYRDKLPLKMAYLSQFDSGSLASVEMSITINKIVIDNKTVDDIDDLFD